MHRPFACFFAKAGVLYTYESKDLPYIENSFFAGCGGAAGGGDIRVRVRRLGMGTCMRYRRRTVRSIDVYFQEAAERH